MRLARTEDRPRYVALSARIVASGELKTAKRRGRDHMVVPVVMMVGDAVVRPLHSEGWELVPATELADTPQAWNGSPVVAVHPVGGTSSANAPEILDAEQFGEVFHARYADGALRAEAYIDVERAEEIGGAAASAVAAVQAGETVEISVGAWVHLVAEQGTSGGRSYDWKWTSIVPDHLAFGLDGARGACSVEDHGCGAGVARAAADSDERITEYEEAATMKREPEVSSTGVRTPSIGGAFAQQAFATMAGMRQRMLAAGACGRASDAPSVAQDESDSEVWSLVSQALNAVVPAFEGIVELWSADGRVVYVTSADDDWRLFERTFTLADGEVTLNDDSFEVIQKLDYVAATVAEGEVSGEAVVADPAEGVAAGRTSVAAKQEPAEGSTDDGTTKEETMRKDELIGRLISLAGSPYLEGDREQLAAFSEERLAELADKLVAAAASPQGEGGEPPKAAQVDEDSVVVSKADWARVLGAAEAHEATMRERHARLLERVKALVSESQVYTEDDLRAMSVADLERIEKFAASVRPEKVPVGGGFESLPLSMPRGAREAAPEAPGLDALRTAIGKVRGAGTEAAN